MGLIDDVIDSARSAFRFKETIIYKEESDLKDKYDALNRLIKDYPNNDEIQSEYYIVKKGLVGENEIAYQLKKSDIGMYVLRDVKFKHEDLTAQIDYVIITPVFTYFVECKNLVGNITVNEKGDFIRELTINNRRIKKGMYSPMRQVEAQREVFRKVWESKMSKFSKFLLSQNFEYYRRVLVVAANQETILNTSKAPKELKYKILRADALVRQIEYEIKNSNESFLSSKDMEEKAKNILAMSMQEKVDYYEYYKDKFMIIGDSNENQENKNAGELKERMVTFRKKRSDAMNMPAYYIFTNAELDRLIEEMPKDVDELRKSKILSEIKVKTHGEEIIAELNR